MPTSIRRGGERSWPCAPGAISGIRKLCAILPVGRWARARGTTREGARQLGPRCHITGDQGGFSGYFARRLRDSAERPEFAKLNQVDDLSSMETAVTGVGEP